MDEQLSHRFFQFSFTALVATVIFARVHMLFSPIGFRILLVAIIVIVYQIISFRRNKRIGIGLAAIIISILIALNVCSHENHYSTFGEVTALSTLGNRSASMVINGNSYILVYSHPFLGASSDYQFDLYQRKGILWYRVTKYPITSGNNYNLVRKSDEETAINIFRTKFVNSSGMFNFDTK